MQYPSVSVFSLLLFGLQNAKIVVNNDSTLVSVFSFKSSVSGGTFNTEGITVLLALIGLLITAILLVKSVKGNILWGILITWGLGIICQLTGLTNLILQPAGSASCLIFQTESPFQAWLPHL